MGGAQASCAAPFGRAVLVKSLEVSIWAHELEKGVLVASQG